MPKKVHDVLIAETQKERIVGHVSRDSTAIEAREKPIKKEKKEELKEHSQNIDQKGKQVTRIEKQQNMSINEMLQDLPIDCDVGSKTNSKGYIETWIGYKLHIDTIDGDIPASCILTSASLHDSQAAIPLSIITSGKLTNLYDLMDAAYDSPIIRNQSKKLGHISIIDTNPRRNKLAKNEKIEENRRKNLLGIKYSEEIRYNERTSAERVNARLKDEFGAKNIRVKGHLKVYCHLMFGILALTADQLIRLVT